MGFPFYRTSYNDSRLRKIKENLRKLNKKRVDLVEIMSLNVVEEAVLQSGGPLAVLRLPSSSCCPGPRSGRSLPSSSSNKIKRDIEKKKNFVIKF